MAVVAAECGPRPVVVSEELLVGSYGEESLGVCEEGRLRLLLLAVEQAGLVCCGWWPGVLELLLPEQFVVVLGGEERLQGGSLAEGVDVDWDWEGSDGGGEACPFKRFMRWWRRHLARLLENQT